MRCTGVPQHGARLAVLAVHRHLGAERRHLLGKAVAAPRARSRSVHSREHRARRRRTAARSPRRRELLRQRHRREPRAVQDLVGVGVADAAEEPRIGQRALERVVLARERRARTRRAWRRAARARRDRARASAARAAHHVQRRALLRCRLGEQQRARREIERGEPDLARDLRRPRSAHCSRPAIIRCKTRNSSSSSTKTMRLPSRSIADDPLAVRRRRAAARRSATGTGSRGAPARASGRPPARRALDVDRDVGQLRHVATEYRSPSTPAARRRRRCRRRARRRRSPWSPSCGRCAPVASGIVDLRAVGRRVEHVARCAAPRRRRRRRRRPRGRCRSAIAVWPARATDSAIGSGVTVARAGRRDHEARRLRAGRGLAAEHEHVAVGHRRRRGAGAVLLRADVVGDERLPDAARSATGAPVTPAGKPPNRIAPSPSGNLAAAAAWPTRAAAIGLDTVVRRCARRLVMRPADESAEPLASTPPVTRIAPEPSSVRVGVARAPERCRSAAPPTRRRRRWDRRARARRRRLAEVPKPVEVAPP